MFILFLKESNFSSVLNDIIYKRNQLLFIDTELYDKFFCYRDSTNLCSKTSQLVPVDKVDEFTSKTVLEFFSYVFNKSSETLISRNPLVFGNIKFYKNKLKIIIN